jgi:hypothetical protein
MARLLTTILLAAAFIAAAQDHGFAEDTKPKKGSYASCVATAMKHGSSSRMAAEWCTRHGY